MQPTAVTHVYASFVEKKVADQCDCVCKTGTVQCLHQGIQSSMTRTLPANSILPNKSQPFSIVWADNTDSIRDLPSMLTYLDNFATRKHRADATRSPTPGGELVESPMVPQPLPPFHPPLLSHGILSLLAMLPLLLQAFSRAFTLARATSSTCSQGQVLSLSLAICSTQSVFLSSATFALLELCPKARL